MLVQINYRFYNNFRITRFCLRIWLIIISIHIQVWFQNRRAKYRKEGHRKKPTPTLNKEEKQESSQNERKMQNVYFSERSKLDIKLDYLKSSTSSQSPSSSATKLRNPKLFQDRYGYKRTLEPSSSSYIWDSPRSKLRISCNDSNHCQCLMCRENGSLAVHY